MKRFLLALSLTMPLSAAAMAENPPGLLTREITVLHHGRTMEMAVWYPGDGGVESVFAENPVFKGGLVRQGATPRAGKYPVVLLSHGMGGSLMSLNWLATGLAERGAVVISVNHPNGWFRDRNPAKMFDHWTRVQDLQAALDNVLADKDFAGSIDPSRIYAAGFSYGGWTALSIAGVTAKPEGSLAYCTAAGERSHNCTDLTTYGFDFANLDRNKWTASYKDSRIRAVAAIDPGITWKLTADDVRDVQQDKLLLIGLGTGGDRLYATDTSSKGSNFESLVPGAKVELLAPAYHFSAMPICKPEGAALLAEDKDDPVCTDPSGSDRQLIHDRIIALVAEHFILN
jgi:predicted dienelactone hydrolase